MATAGPATGDAWKVQFQKLDLAFRKIHMALPCYDIDTL